MIHDFKQMKTRAADFPRLLITDCDRYVRSFLRRLIKFHGDDPDPSDGSQSLQHINEWPSHQTEIRHSNRSSKIYILETLSIAPVFEISTCDIVPLDMTHSNNDRVNQRLERGTGNYRLCVNDGHTTSNTPLTCC